jgi:5-methylcytosine-specific restriction enzyme subunit McrC
VARLPATDGSQVSLRVLPKLPDTDIFFLADYAFGKERDLLVESGLTAELEVLRPDPAACLLAWYLAELEAFVTRWLRRDYQRRTEVLNSKIRGRPLINRYVQRHVARAEPHRVPCEFFDLTRDNLPNRILRRTMHEVAYMSAFLPLPEARQALRRREDRIRPFLADV